MTIDNAAPRPFAGQKGRVKQKGAETLLREAEATIDVLRAQLRDEEARSADFYAKNLLADANAVEAEAHAERLAAALKAEISHHHGEGQPGVSWPLQVLAAYDQWRAQKEAGSA